MNWKLRHAFAGSTASGKSIAPPPAPAEAALWSWNRSLVYEAILCAVISAGPASEIARSSPAASLLSLSRPPAAILRQAASSVEFHIQDITGPAGIPLPLKIEVSESEKDTGGRLFIFSGIPKGVKLDPGGDLGLFWAVNSNVFDRLTLLAPEGFQGSFEVEVTQTETSPDDAKRKLTFLATITAPDAQANTKLLNAIVPPADVQNDSIYVQPPAKNLPNLRDNNLMERAFSLFGNGDVSAARSIFEYLVARGNAEAAIALGGTYDPLILRQLFIKGMTPDPEQARIWYKKAEELGSAEARSRLTALAER